MASTSQVQSDAPAGPQSPQLQQSPAQSTDAVEFDAHPGRWDAVPEPPHRPDLSELEWHADCMSDTYPPDPWGEEASPNASVSTDAHPGSEDTVPEPPSLPDVFKPEWQRDGMPDAEFYRKYPPDPWGEEASPNARVWRIYRDQQDLSHKGMLEGWNKTLDVLLIFAGLFSAVLTAFLIESYKALQPDYAQYVAAFLYAAAVSHNGSAGIFPSLDQIQAPDLFIQTSVAQRWTNGLWFSGLVISLAVALLCILIKQWLDAYDSHVSAASPSPRHWARRHSLYHRGLEIWGVPGLISFLPLLLHLSLFLFFVGLVLFLRPLDGAISYSLLALVSCIGAFYILSLFLPAWRVECPSYTPLLAQAQLAVARATSILPYIMRALDWLKRLTGKLHHKRSAILSHAEQWLASIQLRARERDAHETRTIIEWNPELDGYVLSALIQLPTDSNRDIVNAAYAALAAVGSRTIDVISREVPSQALSDKLILCDRNIPWTVCGFSITVHEQLQRAHEAMALPEDLHWSFTRTSLYLAGVDQYSFLLRALGIEDVPNIDVLIMQLQALSSLDDSSPGLPRRSACLTYLEFYTLCFDTPPLGLSCFLLLFCAGRFARAETQDLMRALRSVRLVLSKLSIDLPAQDAGDRDYIIGMANSLWLMLSESPRYSIDTVTAEIVAVQTFACFNQFFNYNHVVWAQISGLSAFVRSPTFIHCVDTQDHPGIADELDSYLIPFRYPWIVDRASVRLEDYWECIATLLKFSLDRVPPQANAQLLFSAYALFPVQPSHWDHGDRLSEGGPYATQDDWYDPVLSAFLDGPNAIGTWSDIRGTWPNIRYSHYVDILELANLAHRISIVLCRRQRLGRANETFVSSFFSGSFLHACFLILEEHISTTGWTVSLHRIKFNLAKHCLRLCPERFLALCARLEESWDAGSELRARAVALAKRIRNDSAPGGPLSAECDANCACMLPAARAPTSTPTRWEVLTARFRRGHAEPATAPNV